MVSNTRERKINYVLITIKNKRSAQIDKERFLAIGAVEMLSSVRVMAEIVDMLERAGKIDKGIWK